MSATLMMTTGGLLWKYEEIIDEFFSGWRYALLIILIAIYVYVSHYSGIPIQTALDAGPFNLLGYAMACVGVYLVIRFCKLLPK